MAAEQEFLPRNFRIAILSEVIVRGLKEGMTATEIYEQIRGTPLGIRRSDFYALARELRPAAAYFAWLERQPESTIPERFQLPQWRFAAPPETRYIARVRATVRRPTGQLEQVWTTVRLTRLDTLGNIRSRARLAVADTEAVEEEDVMEVHLEELWRVGP